MFLLWLLFISLPESLNFFISMRQKWSYCPELRYSTRLKKIFPENGNESEIIGA